MRKSRVFIFIAALLVTLLMAVGCDVSPNLVDSSVPEGCVNVNLNIGDDRKLDVSSTLPSDITNWTYSLTPLWSYGDTAVSETIYGIATNKPLDSNNIGWVTQGYWKVQVYGNYVTDGNTTGTIYYGETNVYFSENNTSAVVYMKPYEGTEKGSIEIEITQPNLSESNSEYYYCYSISGVTGDTSSARSNLLSFDKTSKTYKASETGLKPDYYNVNISIYKNNPGLTNVSDVKQNGTLIGGEIIGVFVQEDATVTVTGTVDPSDFVKGIIDFSAVCVSGTITRSENLAKDTDISFVVTDSSTCSDSSKYSVSFQWYVNGSLKQDSDSNSFSFKFGTYGPKEVSCVIVYKPTGDSSKAYTATVKDTFTILP